MDEPLIRPHGGYKGLFAFQLAEIIYDGTVFFCDQYVNTRSRTHDQMVQAARSGRQNIAEGSVASGTSSKTEIRLVGVARASLDELRLDYEDFLRHGKHEQWSKESAKAKFIRELATSKDRNYETYRKYIEDKSAETAANTLICLIHQACFLLDRLNKHLAKQFLADGGFSERMYKSRTKARG